MDPAQLLMNERDDPWDLLANGQLQKAVRIRDFMLGRWRLNPDPTVALRQVSERFVAAGLPLNRSVTIVAILHAEAVASVRMWESDKGRSDFAYLSHLG